VTILEKVKKFIYNKEEKKEEDVPKDKVISNFDGSDIYSTGAFFDDTYSPIFKSRDKASILEAQKQKIMTYRNLAKLPDVNAAIEEIVNEIIFTDEANILMLDIDEENEKIKEEIHKKFDKILQLLNLNSQFYKIVRQSYIDGQLIIHCEYNKNLKDGIKQLKMIEPCYFYFDEKSKKWKYYSKDNNFYRQSVVQKGDEYEREEIIRGTFDLQEDKINLSYLEYAIKPANQLSILEDLLIPMRFSRSVARRVFNVDVGELQTSKAEEVMNEMQKKFKYKKFYNTETGEITNQQHITSMVEDYWFANRSGGKGTTVDTIDETGNLGELNDILYFQKKLYKSLNVPSNRISENLNEDRTFDYDSTQTTREDIKFYAFISRLRKMYINMLNELLKRELISTEVMSLEDYNNTFKDKINIKFMSENMFIDKMKIAKFQQKLDIYSNVQEYAGKLFPVETILKDVFNFSDEDIKNNFKMIAQEKNNKDFKSFYKTDEDY